MDYFQWNGEDLECEKFKINVLMNNPEHNHGDVSVNNSILLDDPQAQGALKYNHFCPKCGKQIKYHGIMKIKNPEDPKDKNLCSVCCPGDYLVFSEALYPDYLMKCKNMSEDEFNKSFNKIN